MSDTETAKNTATESKTVEDSKPVDESKTTAKGGAADAGDAADDNDEQHEHTFDSAGAGASLTYPQQCSALRKNGFVVIKGRPCKIIDMSTSKTGKHGHAKVNLVATDIFNGRKYEDISPSTHNMDVPFIRKSTWNVINIDDGFMSLMDVDAKLPIKDDVAVPEGPIGETIMALWNDGNGDKEIVVTVTQAMGEERCTECKTSL